MPSPDLDATPATSIDGMMTETTDRPGFDWAATVICIALMSTAGWVSFLLWALFRSIEAAFF